MTTRPEGRLTCEAKDAEMNTREVQFSWQNKAVTLGIDECGEGPRGDTAEITCRDGCVGHGARYPDRAAAPW